MTQPLFSNLSTDTLEGFVSAPKPKQLVFGDGCRNCFAVDAIRCRTAALRHNVEPIPVANVLDKIERWHEDADFFFVDAGAPCGTLSSLPYTGPGWYWKECYREMLSECVVLKGRITQEDVVCVFRASDHEPADSLRNIYTQIETIVEEALYMQSELSHENDPNNGVYVREETLVGLKKGMLLSMQGAWLMRASPSWSVVNSACSDDAVGPVHMTRKNADDGTTCVMSRTVLLGNKSM